MKRINLDGITGKVTGDCWITEPWLNIEVCDEAKVNYPYPSGWVMNLHIKVSDLEEMISKGEPG